jgi:hypothetical protein
MIAPHPIHTAVRESPEAALLQANQLSAQFESQIPSDNTR